METRSLFRWKQYLFYFSVLSVLFFALTVCGCTTSSGMKMYAGEEVSPDKRAVIKGSKDSSGELNIFEIDKKKTHPIVAIFPKEVYVLPGKHDVVAYVKFLFTHAWAHLWLVAEPGETYVVKFHSKGDRVQIWIENERTGKPVGGVTGSIDEPK